MADVMDRVGGTVQGWWWIVALVVLFAVVYRLGKGGSGGPGRVPEPAASSPWSSRCCSSSWSSSERVPGQTDIIGAWNRRT